MTEIPLWDALLTDGRAPRKFRPKVDPRLVERAAEAGQGLSGRLHDRQLQIRKSFMRRANKHQALPPNATLAASRSEVHLKIEVALLWASAGKGVDPKYATPTQRDRRTVAGRERADVPIIENADAGRALLLPTDPYVAEFRLPDYAKLLGLPTPKTAGASRVRRSLDELAKAKLIWVDRTSGASPRTQLRREDGSGAPYRLPGEKETMLVEGAVRRQAEGNYIALPAALFTNGWVAALSARAIAAFLALLVQHNLEPDKPAFIAPSIRVDRFGLSDDSFYRGVAELVFYGLALHRPAPVQREWSTTRGRVRHSFVPLPNALGNDPTRFLATESSPGR
jgi:hypothetical protein